MMHRHHRSADEPLPEDKTTMMAGAAVEAVEVEVGVVVETMMMTTVAVEETMVVGAVEETTMTGVTTRGVPHHHSNLKHNWNETLPCGWSKGKKPVATLFDRVR